MYDTTELHFLEDRSNVKALIQLDLALLGATVGLGEHPKFGLNQPWWNFCSLGLDSMRSTGFLTPMQEPKMEEIEGQA